MDPHKKFEKIEKQEDGAFLIQWEKDGDWFALDQELAVAMLFLSFTQKDEEENPLLEHASF